MTDALTPEQTAAQERISFGIMELVGRERESLSGGQLLLATMLGAAGAIEALRTPGQSERARIGLATKLGSMLTQQIIALGDAADGSGPDDA